MEYSVFRKKVVLCGNAGVGKTCLVERLIQGQFNSKVKETIGTNTHDWSTKVENRQVVLKIWDTAGQERYLALAPIYFRGSAGAIIVFDVNDENYEQSIQQWTEIIRNTCGNDAFIILAANKSDLSESREHVLSITNKAFTKHKIQCVLTSARTGENVENMFQIMAENVACPESKSIIEDRRSGCLC